MIATRPDVLLRAESLASLIAFCIAYQCLYPGKWGLFASLFLVPDLSLLGYLGGNAGNPERPGASLLYNLAHNYVLPILLGLFAWKSNSALSGEIALIWLSHISFDRFVGYGLKFSGNLKRTHIQTSASL